jgi:hypothetical protein
MERLIQRIDKDTSVVFDAGKFDNWCVFVKTQFGRKPPLDTEYFTFFKNLANNFGRDRVYCEFVEIYESVSESVQKSVLNRIIEIAREYPSPIDRDVALNLVVIYAGMIAERNKRNTVLKERIKRLGMYQVLIENMPVAEAATFSRGMKANEIQKICKERGF